MHNSDGVGEPAIFACTCTLHTTTSTVCLLVLQPRIMNNIQSDGEDVVDDATTFFNALPMPQATRQTQFECMTWANVKVTVEKRTRRGFRTIVEKKEILRGITGFLRASQFVAIIGASGCGKTTLLNVLSGRILPSHGSIVFNGVPLDNVASLNQRLAYVMQQVCCPGMVRH